MAADVGGGAEGERHREDPEMAACGGDSGEDAEDDVYEVEKIVDWKIEDGETLYRVRWKGYSADEDTWEPEEHLEDCKEVLLEFRKKHVDAQPKAAKKESQKLPLDDDLFEADSEANSDWQSDTKEDFSSNKKKKKSKEREGKSQDEKKKKKSKLVKGKPVLESENSSDSMVSESKQKKRILDTKEDIRDSKKHRRDDTKDTNKKKVDKDVKKKHSHSDKCSAQSTMMDDAYFQPSCSKDVDLDLDGSEVQPRMSTWIDPEEEESVSSVSVAEKQPDSSLSSDDNFDVKVKRKKKKHKKPDKFEGSRKAEARDIYLEKKSTLKKQKAPEKVKATAELECKKPAFATPVQKGAKLSGEDWGQKPVDSSGEGGSHPKLKGKEAKASARDVLQKPTAADGKEKNASRKAAEEKMKDRVSVHTVGESLFEKFNLDTECGKGGSAVSSKSISKSKQNTEDPAKERSTLSKEKEVKTSEAKDKPQKRYDSEKEEKGKKEQKGFKTLKEIKSAFDVFSMSTEEKNEYAESQKREESFQDFKSTDEFKSKDTPSGKDRRSTRDETDTWAYIAAEGERAMTEESTDSKQHTVSLGLDMQLELLSVEDFLKHLSGDSENRMSTETISAAQLREAVKNGQYDTVKAALNSKEEYNLDQEDSSGMTLVMLAAAGGHDDILRLLIQKGAKINCRQKNGTTALIHAAEKNNLTTVAILLEAGACVNLQQNSGETALMKACKRGNYDIVRLMIESGADCNISSKHQNNAFHFAKQCNNSLVYDLLKSHLDTLTRVTEKAIAAYFESRLTLVEPVFELACHRLCEGPDYSLEFTYKPPQNVPEGSGMILFIFHANFFGKEVVVRLCGPCGVQAVVLNDNFQLPIILDSHFIYSFSPIPGLNKLYIRLAEAPTAKVKLLIGAYRMQLK